MNHSKVTLAIVEALNGFGNADIRDVRAVSTLLTEAFGSDEDLAYAMLMRRASHALFDGETSFKMNRGEFALAMKYSMNLEPIPTAKGPALALYGMLIDRVRLDG